MRSLFAWLALSASSLLAQYQPPPSGGGGGGPTIAGTANEIAVSGAGCTGAGTCTVSVPNPATGIYVPSANLTDFALSISTMTTTDDKIDLQAGKIGNISNSESTIIGASSFLLTQLTILTLTSANPAIATVSSTSAVTNGQTIGINGAAGTGCSGLNGPQIVSVVDGMTLSFTNYDSTGCTYTPGSAVTGAAGSAHVKLVANSDDGVVHAYTDDADGLILTASGSGDVQRGTGVPSWPLSSLVADMQINGTTNAWSAFDSGSADGRSFFNSLYPISPNNTIIYGSNSAGITVDINPALNLGVTGSLAPSGAGGTFPGCSACIGANVALTATIASPPAGPVLGQFVYFTDAATTADCTVGMGTALSFCVWNGSAWAKP